MSLDEDWQTVEQLVAVDRGGLTQPQAEHLRSLIRTMLNSRNGPERISRRLESKEKFKGKERFLRELARVMKLSEGEELSEQLVGFRELILLGIDKSGPKSDAGHWDFLWLYHQVDPVMAPARILQAFEKVAGKRGDLRSELRDLDSWKKFSTEGGLALLDVAIRKCADHEQREQLENARNWQFSRKGKATPENSQVDSASSQVSRSPETTMASSGPLPDSEVSNQAEESPVAALNNGAICDTGTIDGCILEVSRVIQLHWNRLVSSQEFISQDSQLKQEIEALRAENVLLTIELKEVQSDLKIENEHCGELRKQVTELEKQSSTRERELSAARSEIDKIVKECREAQREAQLARDRAEEYIHAANLQREDALRTFQSTLWDRLSLHLAEVIASENDDPSLNEDQRFFRRRLLEIRDSLRELRVPPY
jgi:predicted  nucleic acid-binding Zn-ribbon protein